ncbi:MAG: MBL fold metallo-hydrolase [Lachnospiraceae bacterium]|nr:MBL fold metallo-hydrolase [Lachnospiraceae bacterium]
MGDIKIKIRRMTICVTNCYYVFREGSDEIVIVDPGEKGEVIYEDVKSLGISKVAGILLTHGHGDHIGGAKKLQELTGAKIYAFEDEAEILRDGVKNLSGWFGEPYGMDADVYLRDNEEFDMAGFHFKVIHTPGHTQGSCCYYAEEDGYLFCGDTIMNLSVGRTDFYSGSEATLMRSIHERIFTLPDETKICSGHGDKTTVAFERENNPCV